MGFRRALLQAPLMVAAGVPAAEPREMIKLNEKAHKRDKKQRVA
jgi:hypothetical protein